MQVHITSWLIVIVMLLTSIVQPFGDQKLLQFLELGTLCAIWMTLWAGTVFNLHQRCEDGQGGTLGWCDALSILIGLLDIAMVFATIAVVLYYTKQAKFDAWCGKVKDKTIGKRDRQRNAKNATKRRSRMESTDVTSFANPTLDVDTVSATPRMAIEMTTSGESSESLALPNDWIARQTEDGDAYYVHQISGATQW
jgi:hypothetical protein